MTEPVYERGGKGPSRPAANLTSRFDFRDVDRPGVVVLEGKVLLRHFLRGRKWFTPHAIIATSLSRPALLLQAHEYATELGRDPWDFAIEVESLRDVGLTNSDLRWLFYQGFVMHAAETTGPLDLSRCFQPLGHAPISRHSCYLLTPCGVEHAHVIGATVSVPSHTLPIPIRPSPANASHDCETRDGLGLIPDSGPKDEPKPAPGPSWCVDLRILRYNSLIVKHFKVPAPNQEIIFATFEDDGWPPRIDDPLSLHPAINQKQRLHDTINSLNRNQRNTLLRFVGDGTGEGICWEPIAQPTSTPPPPLHRNGNGTYPTAGRSSASQPIEQLAPRTFDDR